MPRLPGLKRFFRLADARSTPDLASIDDELRFHLESRVDDLVARGNTPLNARQTALREFGDWNQYRNAVFTIDTQRAREQRMSLLLESIGADLRHAARALRREPGFAIVAILTLALGIGTTTSVFSAVSGVLLRPLPYRNAERLVHIGDQSAASTGRGVNTSVDNYVDWASRSHSYTALALVSNFTPTLTGRGDAERVPVALVTASMFDVFAVRPILGRAFVDADNAVGAPGVAILGYNYWQSRFAGDSSIVGRTITLNGADVQIVGVLPRDFNGPGRLDRPMWGNATISVGNGRDSRSREVFALLRPGVTAASAQAEMTRIATDLAKAYPKENKGYTTIVDPLAARTVADVERPLYLLFGASFFILLIACANLSNLLLVRGTTRMRELAVRTALGAARSRIARQLLTENLLLALLGAAAGLALGSVSVRVLVLYGPKIFLSRPPSLSIGVLLASIGLACLTSMVFGLFPALRMAPRQPHVALREGGTRVASGRSFARSALAVAQLSLAVVLLSASGLVIKSFARVLQVSPGIRPDHLLTASIALPPGKYAASNSTNFYEQLATQLRAAPGVVDVATTSLVPFGGSFDRVTITKIAGEPERAGADGATADRYVVTPAYFKTMGIRLVRGRFPTNNDRFDAPTVAVVDEVFARHTFPGRDPIGLALEIPGNVRPDNATIVGVVNHVKTYGLDVASPGQLYLSNEQFPVRFANIVVRTAGEPMTVAPTLIKAVHAIDADQPIGDAVSMEQLMADLLRGRRFILLLLGTFAVTAIALSVIGLYGVVSYGVTLRRREFGIRVALGARRQQIARLVLLEGGRMALAGAVIGAAGALTMGKLIASLLFEVGERDVTVFATVTVGLLGVAMLACLMPARRATAVDAVEILRGD